MSKRKKSTSKPVMGIGRARIVSALLHDLDSVTATLERLDDGWDTVNFGVGTSRAGGIVMDRNVGPLDLSVLALRSMLEYAQRDIKQALRKFGVQP